MANSSRPAAPRTAVSNRSATPSLFDEPAPISLDSFGDLVEIGGAA